VDKPYRNHYTKIKCGFIVVRAIKPFVTLDTLKMVHNSYFHSITNYRIIWGEIPCIVI